MVEADGGLLAALKLRARWGATPTAWGCWRPKPISRFEKELLSALARSNKLRVVTNSERRCLEATGRRGDARPAAAAGDADVQSGAADGRGWPVPRELVGRGSVQACARLWTLVLGGRGSTTFDTCFLMHASRANCNFHSSNKNR